MTKLRSAGEPFGSPARHSRSLARSLSLRLSQLGEFRITVKCRTLEPQNNPSRSTRLEDEL